MLTENLLHSLLIWCPGYFSHTCFEKTEEHVHSLVDDIVRAMYTVVESCAYNEIGDSTDWDVARIGKKEVSEWTPDA